MGSKKDDKKNKNRMDRAEYNRRYYLKNKKRIAERKAARYRNDPEYKAAIKEGRKRQQEREKVERAKKQVGKTPLARRPGKRTRVEFPDGKTAVTVLYTIGQAAHRVGVSPPTLRKWEDEGFIPQCLYRSKGGHRLYTEDQVAGIKRVFTRFVNRVGPWRLTEEFKEQMHEELDKLHYGVKIDDEEDC